MILFATVATIVGTPFVVVAIVAIAVSLVLLVLALGGTCCALSIRVESLALQHKGKTQG